MASNEYTSSEVVTFTVTASVADASLILTDDWGLTYYYAGSTKILDTGKISGLTENTQYAIVTIPVTASVGEGKLIANALNTLVGKKFNVSFSDDVAYTKYQTTLPTQTEVTTTDKSGDPAYTLIAAANTKDGTARYAKLAAGDKKFAGGYEENTTDEVWVLVDGELKQISKDHSFVQYLVDKGEITREQAADHPDKNIILRAVGVNETATGDIFKIGDYDWILICSDGLTNHVSNDAITKIIAENTYSNGRKRSLKAKIDELIDKANANGGGDNITAVLLEK